MNKSSHNGIIAAHCSTQEHENAQEIIKAGKRGRELAKQILSFSRQSEHKAALVQVQQILAEVLKLSRAIIPSDIEIEKDIQPDYGPVTADSGLSVVYGIVKKYGGEIRVESEPGKGTVFRVFLPVAQRDADIARNAPQEREKNGTESILVVDDEEPIAKLQAKILQRLGYCATLTTSSEDALDIIGKA